MTMPNTSHPDDERLAAYAGGDADAVSDRALAEHVSSCDRCAPLINELTLLRVALAGLPDLAPSRPLRLIPPVAASAPQAPSPLGWLRRLAAPAMAAGAGLVVVGAVGMSGVANFSPAGADLGALEHASASHAAAPGESAVPAPGQAAESPKLFSPVTSSDGSGRSETPGEFGNPDSMSATASPRASEPAASRGEDEVTGFAEQTPEQPWLTLLIAGAAIFGVSTILRFSLAPQAG